MTLGSQSAFQHAMFVHDMSSEDVRCYHVQGQHAAVLVDSVVNSGKTVVEFVQHVPGLHSTIRIVIVAGAVQTQSISEGSHIHAIGSHGDLSLSSLRASNNMFTGRGVADTGNRLFNTTHLS